MSYRIDPRPPLTSEVQRIAAEELGDALRHLAAAQDNPDKCLHECRKRLSMPAIQVAAGSAQGY